ncbi:MULTISPECIES: hypothetical protein [unclassified Streptomyces]|uniref:hypothetical protein n=1 Tax=unclassified Streptomyces TaxID=2593676 RepID=UPI0033903F2F
MQIGAYAFDGKHSKNLLRTPQSNPSSFFGLSRTQRAQGPEMAIIDASVTGWKSCSGTLTTCLSQAAALPAAKITNRNPVQTICSRSADHTGRGWPCPPTRGHPPGWLAVPAARSPWRPRGGNR